MVTGEYSEVEWRLRELTNSDPWGCSPTDMQAFLDSLTQAEESEVLEALKRRMSEGSWRNRYKSLNLLDHILKHGATTFLRAIREQEWLWIELLEDLKTSFEFVDERGKDQGINVRVKAGNILELLRDQSLLEQTRIAEQEKRALMQKRRQEFQQNGNSSGDTLAKSPATWQELPNSTPSPLNAVKPGQLSPPMPGAGYQPVNGAFGITSGLVDDFDDFQSAQSSTAKTDDPLVAVKATATKQDEDEFDDFQSAPPSATPQSQDPFADLLS